MNCVNDHQGIKIMDVSMYVSTNHISHKLLNCKLWRSKLGSQTEKIFCPALFVMHIDSAIITGFLMQFLLDEWCTWCGTVRWGFWLHGWVFDCLLF
jgi:hypothetical protein